MVAAVQRSGTRCARGQGRGQQPECRAIPRRLRRRARAGARTTRRAVPASDRHPERHPLAERRQQRQRRDVQRREFKGERADRRKLGARLVRPARQRRVAGARAIAGERGRSGQRHAGRARRISDRLRAIARDRRAATAARPDRRRLYPRAGDHAQQIQRRHRRAFGRLSGADLALERASLAPRSRSAARVARTRDRGAGG